MLLYLLACAAESTNLPSAAATYEPGPTCAWTETALDSDEESGLGVTVAEHNASLSGLVNATLKWDQTDETTTLTTALSPQSAAWVTGELVDADGAPVTGDTGGMDCPPYLALTGALSLVTADGHLSESLSVEVRSDVAFVGRIDAEVPLDGFGSALPLGFEAEEWDTVVVDVAVNLCEGASTGELAVYAERVSDTEDVSHADDFARWPWDG